MNKGEKALLIGLIGAIMLSFCGFGSTCDSIDDSVLRLHILADSDSESDQQIKLKVRDRLLLEVPELFEQAENRETAVKAAQSMLDEITECVEKELANQNADYGCMVEIVDGMYFEDRQYDGFTMPSGWYSALRITLGEGKGQNWWCVMYPPLCSSTAMKTEDCFNEQQNELLTADSEYEIKFKIHEIATKIKKWFKKTRR